ncbi:MAG: DUF4469 domain-containing protein, partial [Treponema sp.]|nr:DUF4469 domain-containing protein [Treponema sp.]
FPQARLQIAAAFRQYIRDKVKVQFDGIEQAEGLIAEALDEATGQIDDVMTPGNLLDIRGYGLKIEADAAHKAETGLWFDDGQGTPVKAGIIAVNEPRSIKAIVPQGLTAGAEYALKIVTQSSAHGHGTLLKNLREVRSEFKLTAQQPAS